jgi:hypothetical protein
MERFKIFLLMLGLLLGTSLLGCQSGDDDDDCGCPVVEDVDCGDIADEGECNGEDACEWVFPEASTDSSAALYPTQATDSDDDDTAEGYCANVEGDAACDTCDTCDTCETCSDDCDFGCVDEDGDGYGVGGCCLGPDCDDSDDSKWSTCEPVTGGCDPANPTGTATLAFTAKFGQDMWLQFSSLWKASVPGYNDGCVLGSGGTIACSSVETFGQLVVMLCNPDDLTCISPVVVHAVTTEENTNSDVIQNYWGGPEVVINDLPAGDYKVAVFFDSPDSVERGFGWDDNFENNEADWCGIVSESDLMMSDSSLNTSDGNPPPLVVDVTLTAGATSYIGDTDGAGDDNVIVMQHYHSRNISPVPETENGMIVAVMNQGLRKVDLNTMETDEYMEYAGNSYYDFSLTVSDGGVLVDGDVCGALKTADNKLWLLFQDPIAGDGIAGFAYLYDPISDTQIYNKVVFAGGDLDTPCRGAVHSAAGVDYLWVTNVAASGASPSEGFWHANVTAIGDGADLNAGYLDNTIGGDLGTILGDTVDRIAASGDKLYLASRSTAIGCGGLSCVYPVAYGIDGAPTTVDGVLIGGELEGSSTQGGVSYSCVPGSSLPTMGMSIARDASGRDLLFIGNCLEIDVFNLNDNTKLDYNGPVAGTPGFPAAQFGQGFMEFALSPDGNTLWAVSSNKSLIHMYFEKGPGGNRQSYNRWMMLPIDLTNADGGNPQVVEAYNQTDLDGWGGTCAETTSQTGAAICTYDPPEVDPGLDLDFAYFKKYLVYWAPGLAGATPTSIPVWPSIAVGNETLWMRGSGISGVTGLANQGHLAAYDLNEQKVVLWAPDFVFPEQDIYEVWINSVSTRWGFDLVPESNNGIHTRAVFYIPLD